MGIIKLVIQKIKAFRFTIPSLIMLAMAAYRTIVSGNNIQMVGICAAVAPVACQFKNFHRADEDVSPVKDVLASYIANLIFWMLYMSLMLALAWVGRNFYPGYISNPYFAETIYIAICADIIFISAVVPIFRELTPNQRMIPTLVLTNGLVVFMLMAPHFASTSTANIPATAFGVSALVIALTVGLTFAAYRKPQK